MPKQKCITRVLPVTKVIAKVARLETNDVINLPFRLQGKKVADEKILQRIREQLPEDEVPVSLILVEECNFRFSMPLNDFLSRAKAEEIREDEEEEE